MKYVDMGVRPGVLFGNESSQSRCIDKQNPGETKGCKPIHEGCSLATGIGGPAHAYLKPMDMCQLEKLFVC